jgi:hypothetical protein
MAASLKGKRTPITTPPYQIPSVDITPDPPIFSLVTTFNQQCSSHNNVKNISLGCGTRAEGNCCLRQGAETFFRVKFCFVFWEIYFVLSERVILFSGEVFLNLMFDFDFFEGELSLKFLQLCLKKNSLESSERHSFTMFSQKGHHLWSLYKVRSFLSK